MPYEVMAHYHKSQWVLVRWEEQLFELVVMKFVAMVVVAVVVEVQVVVAEEC